jgi:hypothetical protein
MEKIDKVIKIFKSHLNEEPTMSLSGEKIAGTSQAGDFPPVKIDLRTKYKWNPFFKDLVKIMRRKPPKK